MRRTILAVVAVALAAATGCGDGRLRTRGKLLKGGQPCVAKEGESFNVFFVPIAADGKPPTDFYVAAVEQADGTFRATGKDLKGMPPGKYRVAVEHMKNKKDLLGGKYNAENSPFVFDVTGESDEIVIDLDKPPTK